MLHDAKEKINYKELLKPKIKIIIKVMSAQQLRANSEKNNKKVKDVVDPYIRIYSRGLEQDDKQTFKTKQIFDNGFNPIFEHENIFEFNFCCPDLGFLVFEAMDYDYIGSGEMLGREAIPINCIQPGVRIVNLRDHNLEIMQSSCVLCHISIKNLI